MQNQSDAEEMSAALASIREMLAQLQSGELFCMDRGYAWTVESEGYRREIIIGIFQRLPALQQRLPNMWAFIEAYQTIGDREGLIEEIDTTPV